mmetsp:Transcript_80385/g.245717  ORF Transcript_80385/g.245717 Transcript_80385/m.245717 type:complete len:210 (+) Transcript_80385:917-1546(+)
MPDDGGSGPDVRAGPRVGPRDAGSGARCVRAGGMAIPRVRTLRGGVKRSFVEAGPHGERPDLPQKLQRPVGNRVHLRRFGLGRPLSPVRSANGVLRVGGSAGEEAIRRKRPGGPHGDWPYRRRRMLRLRRRGAAEPARRAPAKPHGRRRQRGQQRHTRSRAVAADLRIRAARQQVRFHRHHRHRKPGGGLAAAVFCGPSGPGFRPRRRP